MSADRRHKPTQDDVRDQLIPRDASATLTPPTTPLPPVRSAPVEPPRPFTITVQMPQEGAPVVSLPLMARHMAHAVAQAQELISGGIVRRCHLEGDW